MILAVLDSTNNCDFGIKLNDINQIELVKELAIKGLKAWFEAEDGTAVWFEGYAEPTSELLAENNIKHEIVSLKYYDMEEQKPICDDYVLY